MGGGPVLPFEVGEDGVGGELDVEGVADVVGVLALVRAAFDAFVEEVAHAGGEALAVAAGVEVEAGEGVLVLGDGEVVVGGLEFGVAGVFVFDGVFEAFRRGGVGDRHCCSELFFDGIALVSSDGYVVEAFDNAERHQEQLLQGF